MRERYMLPAHPAVCVVPLISVPETAPNGYHMGGVPDGIGAFRTGRQTFDVILTHELRYNHGKARKHAGSGAFISRWRFDTSCWQGGRGALHLQWGEDLIGAGGVHYWDHARNTYRTSENVPLERLCSADLPAVSALHHKDADGEWGTKERLFLGGEETHTRYKPVFGRALAHVVTGPNTGHTWELPRLGRGSWENVLACPVSQRKTIAILPDDATAYVGPTWRLREPTSELYVFVGKKLPADSEHPEFARAGLCDGTLYGVRVLAGDGPTAVCAEHHELGFGGAHSHGKFLGDARFELVALPDQAVDGERGVVTDEPGTRLQKQSLAAGITQFFRPEDGSWDPREGKGREFWFVTTGDEKIPAAASRLFHLVFDDITAPERGGTIRIVFGDKGGGRTYSVRHLDSACVDPCGRVFVQEDPGGHPDVTRTLLWDPKCETLRVVAKGDPELFCNKGGERFLTHNEESAGIVPVFDLLGEGWYLAAVQCNDHEAWTERLRPRGLSDAGWSQLQRDLYRPGQLFALHVPIDVADKLPKVD